MITSGFFMYICSDLWWFSTKIDIWWWGGGGGGEEEEEEEEKEDIVQIQKNFNLVMYLILWIGRCYSTSDTAST